MELQQTPLYAQYIIKLGWTVIRYQKFNIFIKQFPLYGGLAKIQRITKLFNPDILIPLLKKFRVRQIIVEPDHSISQKNLDDWSKKLLNYFTIIKTPYLPTKTIYIDLSPTEEEIFKKFSEAKRRAVRRAQKNNLRISESANIQDLIKIKNKSSGFLGFITTYGIDKLWNIFAPDHASILLAFSSIGNWKLEIGNSHVVGGVLLLFYDSIAYYWIAGATREGKKLFAPTLLVWEALKLSKKRGMKQFDFVGVWDERNPKQFHEWKGFTKFKEGFGGTPRYYPIAG